jgi:Spy/CpxP family protein refolding chaperone
MNLKRIFLILASLMLLTGLASADAPLHKTLDLNPAQTQQVKDIQQIYRKEFSAKRGELNRENRALRRARQANDSAQVAQLESKTSKLKAELQQVHSNENEAIRKVLNQDQLAQFEAVLADRKAKEGSSRDVNSF